jgi:integrase
MIEAWVIGLRKSGKLAPTTINRLLQNLRTILNQATSEGRIPENPAAHARPAKLEGYERGVFSPAKVVELLNLAVWPDYRYFTLNVLAYATGMRLGEVQGLLRGDLHPDRIEIRHNWQGSEGLKEPKLGSCWEMPLSARVTAVLDRVIRETQPTGIVFYGDSPEVPISKYTIDWNLSQAFKRIGIGKVYWLARRQSFHTGGTRPTPSSGAEAWWTARSDG